MSDYYERVCNNLRAEGRCQIHIQTPDEKDDRITELEAENEGLRSRRLPYREAEIAQKRYEKAEAALQKQVERREEEKLRAVQAENALGALKARRCEGCRWYQIQRHNGEYDCDHDPQPGIDSGAVHKGFCCSYWAALTQDIRAERGG